MDINKFLPKFLRKKQHEPTIEDLKNRLKKLLGDLPQKERELQKQMVLIEALYIQDGTPPEEAKKKITSLELAMKDLKNVLAELSEIVEMDSQINKRLFKPIKQTQILGIWVAVIFGLISAFAKIPDFKLLYNSIFHKEIVEQKVYDNTVLENIKKNISNEAYETAIADIDNFINVEADEGLKMQAKIYKSVIELKTRTKDYGEILIDITNLKPKDYFLESQKILLNAIFHMVVNEDYTLTDEFISKVLNNDNFNALHFDALYYRTILHLKRDDIEIDRRISITKKLLQGLKTAPDDLTIFDMVDASQKSKLQAVTELEFLISQKEENIEEEKRQAQIQDKISSLKIGIKYNVFKMNNEYTPNDQTVNRAKKLYSELKTKYPDMSIDTPTRINRSEYTTGYLYDNIYWKDDVGKSFVQNELISKLEIKQLKKFQYEPKLRERYAGYDVVFIFTREK